MRVKRETIAEQCIALLRGDIFERRLLPGTVLTEEALARDMGVSRATVREVLNTLMVEGLLTRNLTKRSLSVTRLGAEQIVNIYRARRVLEAGGIAAFADREDSALEPLIAATSELVARIEAGDPQAIIKQDIECHLAIVGLAGSTDIVEFYRGLLAKLQLAMAEVTRSHHYDMDLLRHDHVELVELLKQRRIEEAMAFVKDRIDRAEQQLLAAAS